MHTSLHLIDFIIIGIYFALILIVGIKSIQSSKNIRDYSLNIQNISTSGLSMIIFSSMVGATLTVGIIEKIYYAGFIMITAFAFSPLMWIFSSRIIAPNIYRFKGCISVSDIMELLYGQSGRWITNISSIILSIGVIAVQISVMGSILSYCLNISSILAKIICMIIIVIYTSYGGIKSINYTDRFFFFILILTIPISSFIGMRNMNWLEDASAQLPDSFLHLDLSNWGNSIFLVSAILYFLMPSYSPVLIQRFLMAKDSLQLRKSLYGAALIHVPILLSIFCIAIMSKVYSIISGTNNITANSAFLDFLINCLPYGISGLMITGVLAIVMSTTDSWLNTASILCAHDILNKISKKTEKQEIILARYFNVIITILAIILSSFFNDLLDILWFINNFWRPLIFVPLSVGLLGISGNKYNFYTSIVFAIIFTLITKYIVGIFDIQTATAGVFGSALGFGASHYYQKTKFLHKLLKYTNMYMINNLFRYKNIICFINYKIISQHIFLFFIFIIVAYILPSFSIYKTMFSNNNYIQIIFIFGSLFFILLPVIIRKSRNKAYNIFSARYIEFTIFIIFAVLPNYKALMYNNSNVIIIQLVLSFIILAILVNETILLPALAGGYLFARLLYTYCGYNTMIYIDNSIINDNIIHIINIIYSVIFIVVILLYKELEQKYAIDIIKFRGDKIANNVLNKLNSIETIHNNLASLTRKISKRHKTVNKQDNSITIKLTIDEYNQITENFPTDLISSSNDATNFIRGILNKLKNKKIKNNDS